MNRRNWLDLSRKNVTRYDLDYTIEAIRTQLMLEALSLRKVGVSFGKYVNPFTVTPSGSGMTLSVAAGVAYDPNGKTVEVPTTQSGIAITSHATLAKWSLLVLRYTQLGDTPMAKPSDPLVTVNLNLLDSFTLAIVDGTPSGSPAYPAKGASDIILAGLKIPAASTLASASTVDLSQREVSMFPSTDYDAVVGSVLGCTHPNLSSALSNCPANSKILVVSSETLVSPLTISTAGLRIECKAGVTLTSGGGNAKAFVVNAAGTRIRGLRFVDFTTAAVEINSGMNYNFVSECRFSNCGVEVNELDTSTAKNALFGNITE